MKHHDQSCWRGLILALLLGVLPAAVAHAQTPPPAPKAKSPPAATMPLPGAPGAAAAPIAVPPPAKPAADIAGVWIDHTGRGAVEITDCGGKLCGHVYWLQSTVDTKTGRPLVDHKNPEAIKRNKPICGVQVMGNLVKTGTGKAGAVWGSGWIYNPEDGDTHDLEVQLLGPDRLQVMGYAGFKFLNETYTWTRAPQTAQRCGPPRI